MGIIVLCMPCEYLLVLRSITRLLCNSNKEETQYHSTAQAFYYEDTWILLFKKNVINILDRLRLIDAKEIFDEHIIN